MLLLCLGRPAHAQELEPRAYVNTPIGMNFLVAGVGYSHGNLLFDPSLPIEDASVRVASGLLGYVHTFALADQSAKFGLLVPYADLFGSGQVEGLYHERQVSGLADPTLWLSINFYGAPAITLDQLPRYHQDTIVGATFKLTAPLGQYDPDKLVNIGTNRWSFKPELGVSKALGAWIVEGAAAVTWYTVNDDFFGGQKLEQDPIYSLQGHVVYNFAGGWWIALDATYYTGGQTTVAGAPSGTKLENWRTGVTLALPIDRNNSIKFAASTGVTTRTGSDFDLYLLVWQYRWGGGL